jgi:hypothetical protein
MDIWWCWTWPKMVFLTCVPNQAAKILEEIIVKYAKLGPTIISDSWEAYGTNKHN